MGLEKSDVIPQPAPGRRNPEDTDPEGDGVGVFGRSFDDPLRQEIEPGVHHLVGEFVDQRVGPVVGGLGKTFPEPLDAEAFERDDEKHAGAEIDAPAVLRPPFFFVSPARTH